MSVLAHGLNVRHLNARRSTFVGRESRRADLLQLGVVRRFVVFAYSCIPGLDFGLMRNVRHTGLSSDCLDVTGSVGQA